MATKAASPAKTAAPRRKSRVRAAPRTSARPVNTGLCRLSAAARRRIGLSVQQACGSRQPGGARGLIGLLAIEDRAADRAEPRIQLLVLPASTRSASGESTGQVSRLATSWIQRAARTMQAAASGRRLEILAYLAGGPSSYGPLQKATGLAAGPLYFHITKLRLAGLIAPAERNVYELTGNGRMLLAAALLADSCVHPHR